MRGQEIRCPECGATCLRSLAPDLDTDDFGEVQALFLLLTCDGTQRHDFTFDTTAQQSVTKAEGARRQEYFVRLGKMPEP